MRRPSIPHRELYAALAAAQRGLSRGPRFAAAAAICAIALTPILLAGNASAATITFGSPLAIPASKDTANDLDYAGSNVALPGSVFHIPHDGADSALWNVQLPAGDPTAPTGGQVVSVSLEGCAKSNGPAPLTQIHFQSLAPQPGGGAKVELTSQAFEIPVCGAGGASGSTVSTYASDQPLRSAGRLRRLQRRGWLRRRSERPSAVSGRRPLHGDRRRGGSDDGLVHP